MELPLRVDFSLPLKKAWLVFIVTDWQVHPHGILLSKRTSIFTWLATIHIYRYLIYTFFHMELPLKKKVILYSSSVIDKVVHMEFTLQKDVDFH